MLRRDCIAYSSILTKLPPKIYTLEYSVILQILRDVSIIKFILDFMLFSLGQSK